MTPEAVAPAKILERVRSLLAKADATEFPEEADAFRDKADEMIRAQEGTAESHGSGLVLANRDGDLNEFLWDLFPDLRPHPEGCECDVCHGLCEDEACTRPACVRWRRDKDKPVRYRKEPEKAFSHEAAMAGRRAASNIDLSGGRNNLKSTKELS